MSSSTIQTIFEVLPSTCLNLLFLSFNWKDFGGSAKVATELFYLLEPKHADFVSEEEMTQRLDQVLKVYLKKKDDDKSGNTDFVFLLNLWPCEKKVSQIHGILLVFRQFWKLGAHVRGCCQTIYPSK